MRKLKEKCSDSKKIKSVIADTPAFGELLDVLLEFKDALVSNAVANAALEEAGQVSKAKVMEGESTSLHVAELITLALDLLYTTARAVDFSLEAKVKLLQKTNAFPKLLAFLRSSSNIAALSSSSSSVMAVWGQQRAERAALIMLHLFPRSMPLPTEMQPAVELLVQMFGSYEKVLVRERFMEAFEHVRRRGENMEALNRASLLQFTVRMFGEFACYARKTQREERIKKQMEETEAKIKKKKKKGAYSFLWNDNCSEHEMREEEMNTFEKKLKDFQEVIVYVTKCIGERPVDLSGMINAGLITHAVVLFREGWPDTADVSTDFFCWLYDDGRYKGRELHNSYLPLVAQFMSESETLGVLEKQLLALVLLLRYEYGERDNLRNLVNGIISVGFVPALLNVVGESKPKSLLVKSTEILEHICHHGVSGVIAGAGNSGGGGGNLYRAAFNGSNGLDVLCELFNRWAWKVTDSRYKEEKTEIIPITKHLALCVCSLLKGEWPDPPEKYGPILACAKSYVDGKGDRTGMISGGWYWNGQEAWEGMVNPMRTLIEWRKTNKNCSIQ